MRSIGRCTHSQTLVKQRKVSTQQQTSSAIPVDWAVAALEEGPRVKIGKS